MDPVSVAFITFVVVGGSVFAAAVLLLRWVPAVQRERLRAPAPEAAPSSILRWETARAGWQRFVERLGRWAGPRDEARLFSYRQRLAWAGFHDPRAVWIMAGTKAGVALAFALAYPLAGAVTERVVPNLMFVSMALAVLGFLLPNLWLRRRTRARQEAIGNALPDVLDLLTVCVEGGMGFDAALARVSEQPEARKSPLHQEILRMILEMRAGRQRQEALRALAHRCGTQEIATMVSVFIQTDRLGTSMGKTLRVHADTSRVHRRQRAEERAYLAPLKMLFPTALFLMPAFMLVAMGPPLLQILTVLRQAGK
ncbi:MAG: type II secretion system F family protein [Candidatus Rokuibacteriota bacterium]